MPKSIKDLLEVTAKKLGNPDPFRKVLEAEDLTSVELSDEDFEVVNSSLSNLLTPDAALNNPNIVNKLKESVGGQIKSSIYGDLEGELREAGKKLGYEFEQGTKVRDMIGKIKEYQPPKSKDVDTSKYEQQIDQLNKQMAKIREESEKEITGLKTTYAEKEKNQAIERKLGKFKLAEAYDKDLVKKGIYDTIKKELTSKATIKIDDNGEVQLFDRDNPELKIYGDNNKPLTFDDFVEPMMKDFVQKSDPVKDKKVQIEDPSKQKTDHRNTFAPNSMGAHLAETRAKAFNK